MKKSFTLILAFLFIGFLSLNAQASLEGSVMDKDQGTPLDFAYVKLYQGTSMITGTQTDFDGNFLITNIDPGTYDIEASYLGYTSEKKTGVVLKAGKVLRLKFELSPEGVVLDKVVITEYKAPLIDIDNTTTGGTVTAEKIQNLPTKEVSAIAATTAGVSSVDGGSVTIRGGRTNATAYYVDGIRVIGLVPQSEIEQMQVITGGLEAKYGDATGGLISITTKGPSQKFSGGAEVETSQYLDPYGYNLASAYL
ncbi:MAG TPA: TonB-dependent receptor, partial [Bacteroidetes bacterium]|nr:TonB-dependent receptor [Bacteroidota bacterium]